MADPIWWRKNVESSSNDWGAHDREGGELIRSLLKNVRPAPTMREKVKAEWMAIESQSRGTIRGCYFDSIRQRLFNCTGYANPHIEGNWFQLR